MNGIVTRAARAEVRLGTPEPVVTDRSAGDWDAASCSCGLSPGDGRAHPRARTSQRPTAGELASLGLCSRSRSGQDAGRRVVDPAAGSTMALMRLGCLIAPTAADIQDVMVEEPVGPWLPLRPPWSRPRFRSSKRRVEWPNGAAAVCLSGEELTGGVRGLNHRHPLGRRAGLLAAAEIDLGPGHVVRSGPARNPQALITTTPRPARGPPAHPH